MSNQSKKHHYVPQSLLKRFSIENDLKRIYVFDKKDEKSFSSSIENTGSENKYNTIVTEDLEINLENLYQDIDNAFARIINKIIADGSLKNFDEKDFFELLFITANQLKRSKLQRLNLKHIDSQLNQTLESISEKLKVSNNHQKLDSEQIKVITISSSLDVDEEIDSLLKKGIYLIKNVTDMPFYISDSPVALHNSFPYGDNGLDAKGIEIYFPISPEYLIGYCCKTLIHKLEECERLGIESKETIGMLNSIRHDIPFELDNISFVEFYNQLQVFSSHRFVYSNRNDFSIAKEVVTRIPKTKEIKSTVNLGELGKGPPPNRKLPMGDVLVVYGAKDHNLLKIEIISKSKMSIIFRCNKSKLFDKVMADIPFERIECYSNQLLQRLIGKPEITVVDSSQNLYELDHADKSIHKIFELIDKGKTKNNC